MNERLFSAETAHDVEQGSETVQSIQRSEINQGEGELSVGMTIRVHYEWQGAYMGSVTGKIKEIIPNGKARYSGSGTNAYIIVLETKNWRGKKGEKRINTDPRKDFISIQTLS